MTKKIRISITVDGELLDDLDKLLGKKQMTEIKLYGRAKSNRSLVIEEVIRSYINQIK